MGGEEEVSQLCDCHCGLPCPLGKTGMAYRCDLAQVAVFLECSLADVRENLKVWQGAKAIRIEERFRQDYPEGIKITIVEADRPK